jgi:ribosome maturation factor RimP
VSETSSTRALLNALRGVIEPVVERLGLSLVAVELLGGPTRVLRVSIEKVGGATIEDCTRVSRQISPALDVADIVKTAYNLEVSTPGMERPLQREADFAYFTGCVARVKLFGSDGRRRLVGTLRGCEAGLLRFQVGEELREIPVSEVERANLVLDLDQYARLGEGLHPIATEGTP